MLCVGVYLTAWTFDANADDVLLKPVIGDSGIKIAPVIARPNDGQHFSAVPVAVKGSCPPGAAYVELFRNERMAGSAICSEDSTFALQSDLYQGKTTLTAKPFTTSDIDGPVSEPVSVSYKALPITPLNTQTVAQSSNSQPLILGTAFVYKGYYVGQDVKWPLQISGGVAPYGLNIDWGDGTNSIFGQTAIGQFNIDHTYKQPGGYRGSYTIKVQASDAAGNYTYLEFFVIVSSRTPATVANSIYSKGPPTFGGLHQWVWVAWPVYGVVLLMVISFKLGEREEAWYLRRHRQYRHI
ncbi:MAG TPA: hypothetical protein VHD84_00650 [Candidatus Saccharimonadales bacterium]|nr:hypothetical protein [Candidatus Saccharimonadales bacterium]